MNEGILAEYVHTHREELVALGLDLLVIDTANPPGDTREIVAKIEEFLDPLPVDVEQFAVDPAKPNLLVRVPGESDRTLLYNGHLDTVPFDDEAWAHDPRRTCGRPRLRPRRNRHEGRCGVDAVHDSSLRSHRH